MARAKVSKFKHRGGGSPYWNHVEANGGLEAISAASDAESARQYHAEQAQEGTEAALQLEAILDVFNTGGLTELTPMQQKVFQLCVVENVDQEVVANQLGITQPVVSEHLSRACKTLRVLAESRMKEPICKTTNWTKDSIRQIAKKAQKK